MAFSSSAETAGSILVSYKGLAYAWREDNAFLSRSQAAYALERLWERAAGSLDVGWEGPPAVVFPAITRSQVEAMLDLAPGALPWVKLADFLPAGRAVPFDTGRLPALGLDDKAPVFHYDGESRFPLDLPAAAFLMLTRWEDTFRPVRDDLGRPEETAALNIRQRFHDRPILDEWALLLRVWLQKAQPGWQPVVPKFRLWLTHDIDHLYCFKSWKNIFRRMARKFIRERTFGQALKVPVEFFATGRDFKKDPYYKGALDLMDFDEQLGQRGTFFFMTAQKSFLDDGYDLSISPYRDLLLAVSSRGHEIGWHPGFVAAADEAVFAEELERANKNFGPGRYGARRHYLAWLGPRSWRTLEAAGCLYDASLGYNDRTGFRAGTAHPFPAYDLHEERQLNLLVRPLIVQDGGLMQETSFTFSEGLKKYGLIAGRVKVVGGELSILIHNGNERLMPWTKRIIIEGITT